ncbi:unnamed protein product [Anisakis simplex]|uniref:Pyroglutamyl-peptidase I (inferred by orthology to a S. mansoni protein) n=1 Tax=Anisakis simplex TaxID=6269 RepID=A0A0M3JTD8_ANISI|nr:unnamed protein product [Anisakis simplex]
MAADKRVVVVTGFGPFDSFQENPSAAVVRRLEEEGISDVVSDVVLRTEVIQVKYDCVEEKVAQLWQEYHPILVIHIGAHPSARLIRIEQQSFGRGYCSFDVDGQVPCGNVCPVKTPLIKLTQSILATELDCERIVKVVTQSLNFDVLKVETSNDPGRYLCAYSYFMSLSHDKSRALFVHVPGFDADVTVQMVTTAIKLIIKECLHQLNSTAATDS